MDLCRNARIVPAVNQVETHPYTQQIEAMRIMQSLGVQVEAWGPLAEGRHGLFSNSTLSAIGHKYDKSAAQVVLRWHWQRGVVAIPKSVRKECMTENFAIEDFSLTEEDMVVISAMDTGHNTILNLHTHKEIERFYNIDFKN